MMQRKERRKPAARGELHRRPPASYFGSSGDVELTDLLLSAL
jgi:hypothetical protein